MTRAIRILRDAALPVAVVIAAGVYADRAAAFSGVPGSLVPDALSELTAPATVPVARGTAGWRLPVGS